MKLPFFNNSYETPKMPEDKDEMMKQVWVFCYNHFPGWRKFVEVRFSFTWIALSIIMALLGCLIGLRVAG